jgi:hypothetical protein
MTGSLRTRLEQQDLAAKYKAQSAPKIAQQEEDARAERLAQNARKISEDKINVLLLDMSDDEREVVYEIVNRERPDSLGSSVVLEAALLRVRELGTANLRDAMQGSSRAEQRAVFPVLMQAPSAAERLGLDGGAACREALRKVRSEAYFS